jgi:hypothetical protein
VSGAADLYAIVELDEDYGPRASGEAARNGKEGRFVLASVVLVPEDAEAIDRAARMVGWTDPVADAAARRAVPLSASGLSR